MTTMHEIQVKTINTKHTQAVASAIGDRIKGGEVIELISDVGGGKTTLVKGLASGMGSSDTVRSPSFAINHEYKAGNLVLHHLDFYRLKDAGIMKEMLAEALTDDKAVVVIEWADIVKDVLPERKLIVRIKVISEDEREISFSFPDELEYLVKGLTR
jgi:tRNA threonylcarbamoyladenosine biosynthesis protein TsaE